MSENRDAPSSTNSEGFWERHSRLHRSFHHAMNESTLLRSRNMALGMAAFAGAAILLLAQTGVASTALKVSLFSFSICIPMSIASAFIAETYLITSPASLGHYRRTPTEHNRLSLILSAFPQYSLAVGISSIVWHLSFAAFFAFVGMIVIAYLAYFLSWHQILEYVDDVDRSGDSQE